MAYFRQSTSKSNTYLQLVESYRNQKGQSTKRVLAGIGNITKMSEEKIERLTLSFIRAAGMEKKFQKYDFEVGKGYHYGTLLPAIAIWHQLGMEEIINKCVPKKVAIPVSRIALIQTANRFSDPGSKLACFRWYYLSLFSQMKNFVNFPADEDERLHTFYRALDYLCRAKKQIERELYYRLLEYGIDNSLILYDITSTYFEGTHAQLGKKGYSRDKRSDLEQIVVGIVMSRDGIPIAHHVFEGNRLDKTTVKEVVDDLKARFRIESAIFVGDRGMITFKNIESIKENHYEYILGLQRRNRKVIEHLLGKVMEDPDEPIQEFGYAELSVDLQKSYPEDIRFVVCYNEEVAQATRKTRDRNRTLFQELRSKVEQVGDLKAIKKSNDRLKLFLSQKHMTRFYQVDIEKEEQGGDVYRLKVEEKKDIIQREEYLDGRYFLQTEVSKEIEKEEIDTSYKSLQVVERAFRMAKHEIDIRPIYVQKETRIRGHVMISYFALLIERLIDKKLKDVFPDAYGEEGKWVRKVKRNGEEPLTMMTLYEELDTVRLIPLKLKYGDNEKGENTYICTKIENNVKKFLSALGVKNAMNPVKLSFRRNKNRTDNRQLLLEFGG